MYQGKYADAIMNLEKIIEIDSLNKEMGLELFYLHIQQQNIDDANNILKTLYNLNI